MYVDFTGVHAEFSENRFHRAILLGTEEIPHWGLDDDYRIGTSFITGLEFAELHERIMLLLPTSVGCQTHGF